MQVDYVGHLGDDLMVVNAARVSFSKHKEELDEDDKRLIKYLARNNHWTPFSHPQISLRVKAPVFVRTQLFKHKVGMTENEVSRRYVDDTPEFYMPLTWRSRPTDGAKQGSGGALSWVVDTHQTVRLIRHHNRCRKLYEAMLKDGVAPEQARMVLPQSMYTEFYWTGSLAAYGRIAKLRLDPHAQAETREVAEQISNIIRPLFPSSWEALTGG